MAAAVAPIYPIISKAEVGQIEGDNMSIITPNKVCASSAPIVKTEYEDLISCAEKLKLSISCSDDSDEKSFTLRAVQYNQAYEVLVDQKYIDQQSIVKDFKMVKLLTEKFVKNYNATRGHSGESHESHESDDAGDVDFEFDKDEIVILIPFIWADCKLSLEMRLKNCLSSEIEKLKIENEILKQKINTIECNANYKYALYTFQIPLADKLVKIRNFMEKECKVSKMSDNEVYLTFASMLGYQLIPTMDQTKTWFFASSAESKLTYPILVIFDKSYWYVYEYTKCVSADDITFDFIYIVSNVNISKYTRKKHLHTSETLKFINSIA